MMEIEIIEVSTKKVVLVVILVLLILVSWTTALSGVFSLVQPVEPRYQLVCAFTGFFPVQSEGQDKKGIVAINYYLYNDRGTKFSVDLVIFRSRCGGVFFGAKIDRRGHWQGKNFSPQIGKAVNKFSKLVI